MRLTNFFITPLLIALCLVLGSCDVPIKKKKIINDSKFLKGGTLIFEDNFNQENISSQWTGGRRWEIKNGWLAVSHNRNDALWLNKPLPNEIRVEFDARSESADGDIKCEIFADGVNHASGYIIVFGGWKNTSNIIAKLDEHKNPVKGRKKVVDKGKVYHFAVLRVENRLSWYLDNERIAVYDDKAPLIGPGHEHFGFNDWDTPIFFDNVKIYDLSKETNKK